jgi:hypothetical protein
MATQYGIIYCCNLANEITLSDHIKQLALKLFSMVIAKTAETILK